MSDAMRKSFEAYFAYSRRNRGAGKRPSFDVFQDGTYADDHTQRHWWTWQKAQEPLSQPPAAPPSAPWVGSGPEGSVVCRSCGNPPMTQRSTPTQAECQPLVKRLRAYVESTDYMNAEGLCAEAADNIERLQEREDFILNVTRDAQQIAGVCGAEVMKLQTEIARLRVVGGPLANVAYNLAQKPGHALTSDDVALLDKLRREWDAALRA